MPQKTHKLDDSRAQKPLAESAEGPNEDLCDGEQSAASARASASVLQRLHRRVESGSQTSASASLLFIRGIYARLED